MFGEFLFTNEYHNLFIGFNPKTILVLRGSFINIIIAVLAFQKWFNIYIRYHGAYRGPKDKTGVPLGFKYYKIYVPFVIYAAITTFLYIFILHMGTAVIVTILFKSIMVTG